MENLALLSWVLVLDENLSKDRENSCLWMCIMMVCVPVIGKWPVSAPVFGGVSVLAVIFIGSIITIRPAITALPGVDYAPIMAPPQRLHTLTHIDTTHGHEPRSVTFFFSGRMNCPVCTHSSNQ